MDLGLFEEIKGKLNLARMSKPALIGIAVILVMVAVASAGRLILGTATANDLVVKTSQNHEEPVSESEPSSSEGSALFVHISGAVAKPGLVELSPDARVADAVDAAGGFTDDAMPESVNLARPLEDGEQIKVLTQAEHEERYSQAVESQTGTGALETGAPETSATAASSTGSGKVNINTAGSTELQTLPGIGEVTANKIISDRAANGPFATIEDIKRVSGIADKRYEAIADLICV